MEQRGLKLVLMCEASVEAGSFPRSQQPNQDETCRHGVFAIILSMTCWVLKPMIIPYIKCRFLFIIPSNVLFFNPYLLSFWNLNHTSLMTPWSILHFVLFHLFSLACFSMDIFLFHMFHCTLLKISNSSWNFLLLYASKQVCKSMLFPSFMQFACRGSQIHF